ncbi:hypothetical protein BO86DRAFT_42786 [Aspergillus japonicus CBS 114.51]|uniref:Uncharacterized protein n=1 Tax=Aspergillus japonicus CBS 114.51 TaxID=1448312 RepID=A0A8T8X802_ASPJA|nr:hypothetical protein BO86DRAFT_42786 [Aspergillus japonicus CBS 114.51]RAH83569.1 hypothetical protein BO86DRAFT_42786 [Aspergillus japonicus CBS 114.51]
MSEVCPRLIRQLHNSWSTGSDLCLLTTRNQVFFFFPEMLIASHQAIYKPSHATAGKLAMAESHLNDIRIDESRVTVAREFPPAQVAFTNASIDLSFQIMFDLLPRLAAPLPGHKSSTMPSIMIECKMRTIRSLGA